MKRLLNLIPRSLKNNLLESIVISVFIILLFIPLFWKKYVEFDVVKFTEEYYKTLIVCIGISVLIIFYTDKNKERRKRQLIKKRESLAIKIKNNNYTTYEDVKSDMEFFLNVTREIDISYNSTYLNSNEEFAKTEMEYLIKNCNNNNYIDYSSTFDNIKNKL